MTEPMYPPPAMPPYQAPPPPTPPAKNGIGKGLLIGVGVAALVVGIALGAASGGSKKADAKPGPTVTATHVVSATVTTTPTIVQTQPVVTKVLTTTYTPPPQNQFTDGVQLVGTDIPAGNYKTDGKGDGVGCYYAILNTSNTDDIGNNDLVSGPTRVTLAAGKYFETSGGCSWQRVG